MKTLDVVFLVGVLACGTVLAYMKKKDTKTVPDLIVADTSPTVYLNSSGHVMCHQNFLDTLVKSFLHGAVQHAHPQYPLRFVFFRGPRGGCVSLDKLWHDFTSWLLADEDEEGSHGEGLSGAACMGASDGTTEHSLAACTYQPSSDSAFDMG